MTVQLKMVVIRGALGVAVVVAHHVVPRGMVVMVVEETAVTTSFSIESLQAYMHYNVYHMYYMSKNTHKTFVEASRNIHALHNNGHEKPWQDLPT